MPLQLIMVDAPFMQLGLDVIRPINPNSSQGHSYILTITYYFTKWKEARALKKEDIDELFSFVEENIFSRFRVT